MKPINLPLVMSNVISGNIPSSSLSNWNGVMESGGVIWIGVCAVAWNVERCAMWNEVERGLECGTLCDVERGRVWAVGWNVERCAMWNEVECGLWHGMR